MKKILCFDSWTGGIRHYARLVKDFAELDMELVLVHIGSLGSDLNRPTHEELENINVYDITFYKTTSFTKVLEIEKPIAVIFLSTDTFMHRAFNRIAQHNGIITIHLFHGLVTALPSHSSSLYKKRFFNHLKFVSVRLIKMITKVWPIYISSLVKTNFVLKDFVRFITDNIDLLFGRNNQIAAPDAKADLCCVYTDSDKTYAINKYGYDKSAIKTVGNPDLVQFGFSEKLLNNYNVENKVYKDVMYIDAALILRGSSFNHSQEHFEHLFYTHEELKKIDKSLVVKLHPHLAKTEFKKRLIENSIRVSEDEHFINELTNCCAAIVEPSSVDVIPALLGIPVFMAKYNQLSNLEYGEIISQYPRSLDLESLSDFDELFSSFTVKADCSETLTWICNNSGPLPSEIMPSRVVSFLSSKL